MLRFVALLLLACAACSAQLVDRTQPEPQTPRQALIEILKGKDASAIERHLPEIAKKKLREFSTDKDSGLGVITPERRYAMVGSASENIEVFEAGPLLARFGGAGGEESIEIVIESEDFRGDETDLELAFHLYKKGEEATPWYMPRLTLNMKQEGDIWRLAEVGFTARLRFANPEFLEGIAKEFRQTRNRVALVNLQMVSRAQNTYAEKYPHAGYACSLGSLGGGGKEPAKRVQGPLQAMLIEDTLASGRKDGYTYAISNCSGRPADRFTVTAAPQQPASGIRLLLERVRSGSLCGRR